LVQRFDRMVRERAHDRLEGWLDDCASSHLGELISFATGMRADYTAIKAALSMKWSNGPTEGHINRLKMIKRLMFGRAKFDLLRIRVLQPM
jgi:transposase